MDYLWCFCSGQSLAACGGGLPQSECHPWWIYRMSPGGCSSIILHHLLSSEVGGKIISQAAPGLILIAWSCP